MGATSYLFNDYVKDMNPATQITVVGTADADKEDANYPVENMQNEDVALCSRSDDKGDIQIRFNLGGSVAIKAVCFLNHNLSGGAPRIYSYTAADFSTGATLEATTTYRAKDMYEHISSPNSRQYWEIDLTDNGTATSADAYFEWGRVLLYTDFVSFTEAEDWDIYRSYVFRNVVNETAFGVRRVHKLTDGRNSFDLLWSTRQQTNVPAEMITLYDAVDGVAHPFVYIPDLEEPDVYYVRNAADELSWRLKGQDSTDLVFGTRLSFIEETRGKA